MPNEPLGVGKAGGGAEPNAGVGGATGGANAGG